MCVSLLGLGLFSLNVPAQTKLQCKKDFHHTNKAKSCHKYKARERQSENKTNQQREQEYKLIQLIAKNTCNSPKPTKQTKQTNKLTNEQSKKNRNRNNNNKIIQTVTLAATLAKETNVNAQTNYEHQVKPLLLQNPTKTARTPSSYTNNNNTNNDERQSRTSESEK